MSTTPTIFYTKTDEAPALATHALLPVARMFARAGGAEIALADISLAARTLCAASGEEGSLEMLGKLALDPRANIVKLPNISASVPQLAECVAELKAHSADRQSLPEVNNETTQKVYSKVLGSAVNPVLREGNSDRRVAPAVKAFAKANPHSMGKWSKDSKSHVDSMPHGDFFGSEQSVVISDVDGEDVKIVHVISAGMGDKEEEVVLKASVKLEPSEIVDASVLGAAPLRAFLARAITDAKEKDVLFSIHLKATMMKVSDPIIFGHAVAVFFAPVFEKHAANLAKAGVQANLGLGDLYKKITTLPEADRTAIEADIQSCLASRPALAMVDSDKGITNLHVSSDVIIDASMPAAIRSSGQMWGPDGKLKDIKAVIPDRSYAGVFQAAIDFCRENGAFDVTTMGSVSNVGLMAKKAEEYGSHDKTFEIAAAGEVRVVSNKTGTVLMRHAVAAGDIYRMCQTKDAPIRDWVKLAVSRARATGAPALFWLDPQRAHDRNIQNAVERYLPSHDTAGLDIRIKSPIDAALESLKRCKEGVDTISVTGNVLRDYLTDLFPILELGTSAKMLSIVPLLAGGGLYETGAGGSAPKHVEQFIEEGHLRWDSLGEYLALAVSLHDLATKSNSKKLSIVATALDKANHEYLLQNKAPSRRTGELDNRGSTFFLTLFWAQALSAQSDDAELAAKFAPLAKTLGEKTDTIVGELNAAQGQKVDIGGYYEPDDAKASAAMRPSSTLNSALAALDPRSKM